MKQVPIINWLTIIVLSIIMICSCRSTGKKSSLLYETFRDSLIADNRHEPHDTSNIFDDADPFTPSEDSFDSLLLSIDTFHMHELSLMNRVDSLVALIKHGDSITEVDKSNLLENSRIIDSFLEKKTADVAGNCTEKGCYIFLDIVKSQQKLFLYLDGELKDSFDVSSGIRKYRTPDMDRRRRPSGPLLKKYTSRKWPGGNYKGLGNMPYAIFIRGGYAIHGTTPGNFSKLGYEASHGCIRLHPDNARVLFELVKLAGLANTWVRIRE